MRPERERDIRHESLRTVEPRADTAGDPSITASAGTRQQALRNDDRRPTPHQSGRTGSVRAETIGRQAAAGTDFSRTLQATVSVDCSSPVVVIGPCHLLHEGALAWAATAPFP